MENRKTAATERHLGGQPEVRKKIDTKEFDLPETLFIHDIDNQAIQNICAQILERIGGVHLSQDSFIDSLLGKKGAPSLKGIIIEQDPTTKTVKIRMELIVDYGVSIPEVSRLIFSETAKEVPELTGLPISQIHLFYRDVRTSFHEKGSEAPYPVRPEQGDYNDSF